MAPPTFSLGYQENRGNGEILLTRFVLLILGKSFLFYFFIFWFEHVLPNHIFSISEIGKLYLLSISQIEILYEKIHGLHHLQGQNDTHLIVLAQN